MVASGAAVQPRRLSSQVQTRRDRGADRARPDDRNAHPHLRQATALPFIPECWRAQWVSLTSRSERFGRPERSRQTLVFRLTDRAMLLVTSR
jgi:hypothetical protein